MLGKTKHVFLERSYSPSIFTSGAGGRSAVRTPTGSCEYRHTHTLHTHTLPAQRLQARWEDTAELHRLRRSASMCVAPFQTKQGQYLLLLASFLALSKSNATLLFPLRWAFRRLVVTERYLLGNFKGVSSLY